MRAPLTRPRQLRVETAFTAIRIEGGLFPAEFLQRVANSKAPGQSPEEYAVPPGRNLRDEIGRYWTIAEALWREYRRDRLHHRVRVDEGVLFPRSRPRRVGPSAPDIDDDASTGDHAQRRTEVGVLDGEVGAKRLGNRVEGGVDGAAEPRVPMHPITVGSGGGADCDADSIAPL